MTARIEIDMNIKCKQCGDRGAAQNGYCMKCIMNALKEGKFDHIIDRHRYKVGRKRE